MQWVNHIFDIFVEVFGPKLQTEKMNLVINSGGLGILELYFFIIGSLYEESDL